MVALHAKRFRSIALFFVEPFIGKHTLADMNTTVINQINLANFSTGSFQDTANRFTKSVVAQMTKMQRLVCVRRIYIENGQSGRIGAA